MAASEGSGRDRNEEDTWEGNDSSLSEKRKEKDQKDACRDPSETDIMLRGKVGDRIPV